MLAKLQLQMVAGYPLTPPFFCIPTRNHDNQKHATISEVYLHFIHTSFDYYNIFTHILELNIIVH